MVCLASIQARYAPLWRGHRYRALRLQCFEEAFQFGERGEVFRTARGGFGADQAGEIAQNADCCLELHQRRVRAAPRTFSIAMEALSAMRARSAGVRRNCSMRRPRSIPYRCAASMRLPGSGFRLSHSFFAYARYCDSSIRSSSSPLCSIRTLKNHPAPIGSEFTSAGSDTIAGFTSSTSPVTGE